ncbi:hypothetical protein F4861DRAFT_128796 [Xylaria intraflava]|nr:hypothetical protein F4861DRAFT_128796 [Xylaria intraflava]
MCSLSPCSVASAKVSIRNGECKILCIPRPYFDDRLVPSFFWVLFLFLFSLFFFFGSFKLPNPFVQYPCHAHAHRQNSICSNTPYPAHTIRPTRDERANGALVGSVRPPPRACIIGASRLLASIATCSNRPGCPAPRYSRTTHPTWWRASPPTHLYLHFQLRSACPSLPILVGAAQ